MRLLITAVCCLLSAVCCLLSAVCWLPNSTTEFVNDVVCSDENEKCMLGGCTSCKDSIKFLLIINDQPSNALVETVSYKQWGKNDECRIQRKTFEGTVKEVTQLIKDKLPDFVRHVFVRRMQAKYFDVAKSSLQEGEVLIQMDFSQNYQHKTQDEIQSAYYAYESSTLFTTMMYFQEAGETCEEPFVIITDFDDIGGSKGHDKYAVSSFTRLTVNKFLARRNSDYKVESLKFFSDGTCQHFKQKYSICQVVTLNFSEKIDVSWHFFATSHGKGPIDGLGSTIKRRVTEYSMANRQVDMVTTEDFARVAKERCPNLLIDFEI